MLRGKSKRAASPDRAQPLNLRAARITEAEHFCDFIECFARGVIHRPAQNAVIVYPAHLDQQRCARR